MTSATPWLGAKRIAFVPLYRPHAVPPDQIPPDWENMIRSRVLYNPRPEANGADRSLRAWLRAVSWGRADIEESEWLVLPMQTIDKQVVLPWDLDGIPWEGTTLGKFLRNNGVQAAQLVMLGGRGSGTSQGFWSRVVMAESNGTWLMELIHSLTGFWDLYPFNNDTDPANRNIGYFDEMSAASQTHPTFFTKNELGWYDSGHVHAFPLEALTQQPIHEWLPPHSSGHPPPGPSIYIMIGTSVPYMIIEARRKTDQFETGMPSTGDPFEMGIPAEGVIAYRVQTRDPTVGEREGGKIPLYLLTLTPLRAGQSAVLDNNVQLKVEAEDSTGFLILASLPNVQVPKVAEKTRQVAKTKIENAGLKTNFVANVGDTLVSYTDPDGDTWVPLGSIVTIYMYNPDQ
jgi:hypothetical protein